MKAFLVAMMAAAALAQCDPGYLLETLPGRPPACVPIVDAIPRIETNAGIVEVYASDLQVFNMSDPYNATSRIISLNAMYDTMVSLQASVSSANRAISQLSSLLSAESSRAIYAEGQLAIFATSQRTAGEAVEASIGSSLQSETMRAISVQASLGSGISLELNRAVGVEASLSLSLVAQQSQARASSDSLSFTLAIEISRALLVEASLSNVGVASAAVAAAGYAAQSVAVSLNLETLRATNVEASLGASVLGERSRAIFAERSLYSSVFAPCPVNSSGVPGTCTCNAGFSGTLLPRPGSYDGVCMAVPCPSFSAGANVPGGCTCIAGYTGSVTATLSSPFFSNTCSPVSCPSLSSGTNVPSGCACFAGCSGAVVATTTSPFYVSSCAPVACPASSSGANVPSGCTCNAGYSGSVTGTTSSPFYSSTCTPVVCPANSAGTNVPAGCTCNAGFVGSVIPSTISPFFNSSCAAVLCPANSAGTNVPSGCTCNAGYSGSVTATSSTPFFTSTCTAVACPSSVSTGVSVPAGCTCRPGYSGSVTSSTVSPFYTSTCTEVACPTSSTGVNVPSGCTCTIAGTVTASSTSPFYISTCTAPPALSCTSVGGTTSGTYNINPYGTGAFSVYCDLTSGDSGWTLVNSRTPGVVMFTESGFNPLLTSSGNGRVTQIWSLSSTFSFTSMRFTDGLGSYATITFPAATTLANLNSLYSSWTSSPVSGTVTTNVASLSGGGFYFRGMSGSCGPFSDSCDYAFMGFSLSSISSLGDGWDVSYPAFILAGCDYTDPASSSDVSVGLHSTGSLSCHWHSTCATANGFASSTVYVWLR